MIADRESLSGQNKQKKDFIFDFPFFYLKISNIISLSGSNPNIVQAKKTFIETGKYSLESLLQNDILVTRVDDSIKHSIPSNEASLSDPSIKFACLVYEHCSRGSFASLIQQRLLQGKYLNEGKVWMWLDNLCSAVESIHGLGLAHRNISLQ